MRTGLVTLDKIQSLEPIEGADLIEVARVRDWSVVVGKGEFRKGQRVMFCEVDALLPVDSPRFAFLAERSTVTHHDGRSMHRLKTMKLRGQYSQGLVVPATLGDRLAALRGKLAERHGIEQWQAQGNAEYMATRRASTFPTHLGRKTDSERAQNLGKYWDAIAAHQWYATEKIDGTSCSVFCDPAGRVYACSRNYEIEQDESVYWQAVRDFNIDWHLEPGVGVQFEIYGEGVQGNPLGMLGLHIAIHTYTVDRKIVPRRDWPTWARRHAVIAYPALSLPGTVGEAVAQVDGLKSLVAPKRLAEGIVWHTVGGETLRQVGDRATFKVINNRYLASRGE